MLSDIGLDVSGLVDFADAFFVDSNDWPVKELSFIDFMEMVVTSYGTNPATVNDIMELHKILRNNQLQIIARLERLLDKHLYLTNCAGLDSPSDGCILVGSKGGAQWKVLPDEQGYLALFVPSQVRALISAIG